MQLKDINQLLEPGPWPIETGYCRLPGKLMFVAISTCMPGCKARWVEWATGINTSPTNGKNHRDKSHTNKKLPLFNIDAKHPGKYLMQPQVDKTEFERVDPSVYFDVEKLKIFKAGKIACFKMMSDNRVRGHNIHVIINTEYGCELKSYFWLKECTEEKAKNLLRHYKSDAGNMAEYLPVFIKEIKKGNNSDNIECKYCYSDEVVKNGRRKGGQYWLCKNCGHCFINNGALPNMKYSYDVVARAVSAYISGKSLKSVRQSIEVESSHIPSTASLYRWLTRLTDMLNEPAGEQTSNKFTTSK
jgi:transposase-like protein